MVLANSLLQDWDGFYSWVKPKAYSRSYIPSDGFWKDEEGNYVISFNVPGYGKEDVSAKILNGVLNIKIAEKKTLSYRLPKEYDVYATKISVDKGVLTIKVPRKTEDVSEEFELTID